MSDDERNRAANQRTAEALDRAAEIAWIEEMLRAMVGGVVGLMHPVGLAGSLDALPLLRIVFRPPGRTAVRLVVGVEPVEPEDREEA